MIFMDNASSGLPLTRSHVDKIFPKLTPKQTRRIALAVKCVKYR